MRDLMSIQGIWLDGAPPQAGGVTYNLLLLKVGSLLIGIFYGITKWLHTSL